MVFSYRTDAETGEVEAGSLQEALKLVVAECGINDRTISDGAFAIVEDGDGGRLVEAPENVF